MKKVRFILSPTGMFGLGYNPGDEAEFEAKQAEELVESGFAKYADLEGKAKKAKEGNAENADDKGAAAAEKS